MKITITDDTMTWVEEKGLARAADMSVGNVRNYERGIRLPSFPGVVKLATALGVDWTAFSGCEDVSGEPEEPAKKKGRKKSA